MRGRAVRTQTASAFWGELGTVISYQELSKEAEPFKRGVSNGKSPLDYAQKQKSNSSPVCSQELDLMTCGGPFQLRTL